jgi:acetylornithine deacetylase/succinyl-diaminopimelate desuccinylase-like protein
MDLVRAVQQLNADYTARSRDPQLGVATVMVTRLQSDGGMNLAAREVTVWFDGRFLPGISGEEFAREVEAGLRAQLPDRVDFVMDDLTFVSPPNRISDGPAALAHFFAAVEAVTGTCQPEGFAYGSEAGVLAEFSDASLVFGPGDPRYSHAEVEVIDLDELQAAVDVFRRVLIGT